MYFKNQLIHTNNCNSCCKEYCNNCYSISLEEIELLIEQLEDQILTNSEGWMNKIRYDFKSCYNKETHLICGVYLRFLKRYRNNLMFGGKQILKKFEINKALENIKDVISVCNNINGEVTSLQIDNSNYEVWAVANPEYAKLPEWEIRIPSDYKLTYEGRIDYDSLTQCNITFDTYSELRQCNLTHELIKEIIGCNMIIEPEIESDKCILTVNNNNYPVCDLKFNPTLQEELINDLKEINLI
jgi:hypothetical protein